MNRGKFLCRQFPLMISVVSVLLPLATSTAQQRPPTATPIDGEARLTGDELVDVTPPPDPGGFIPGLGGVQGGADHIVAQQCTDDGWGWPHNDCSATYHNITAPIATGLLRAHSRTGDPAHLAAAQAAGDFDLLSQYTNGEARFGTFTPQFMVLLSDVTGDMTYRNFAEIEFYDALDAGAYGPSDYDTAGFIAYVQAGRAGTWVNLLPWEFHLLIGPAADSEIGNLGQKSLFQTALLDGLNTLDNTDPANVYSDIVGLAGGVRGLATNNVLSFPPIDSPNHALIDGISSLCVLANTLASLQNPDGSWHWHSDLSSFGGPTETDKDAQTTAYAVLALLEAQKAGCGPFAPQIAAGRDWLWSMQQLDGGFLSYPSGTHNTTTEGEVLTAATIRVGDIDGNDFVNVFDLIAVLSVWGPCSDCPEDFDANGVVDIYDLLTVLAHWG